MEISMHNEIHVVKLTWLAIFCMLIKILEALETQSVNEEQKDFNKFF